MFTPAFQKIIDDNAYVNVELIGDGRYVCLHRLMFHWTMIIGHCEDAHGYDDRYCYETHNLGRAALAEWKNRDFKDEPIGWHRHPKSGRRRTNGDPNTEYIED